MARHLVERGEQFTSTEDAVLLERVEQPQNTVALDALPLRELAEVPVACEQDVPTHAGEGKGERVGCGQAWLAAAIALR